MAALVLKAPQVAINADEAMKLAAALKNLSQFYNITPNPQVMAWLQLVGVATAVYGPRVAVTIAMRKQAMANSRANMQRSNDTANSAPIPQPAAGSKVPGAFEAPPPMQGVYKFQ